MKLNILLIGLFAVGFVQADVYKYINKQGKTAYSDRPVAGAEKVIVPPIMTYKAPVVPIKSVEQSKASANVSEQERIPYQYIEIIQPKEESTVNDNQGIVNVSYSLQPSLQEGDRVELLIDGVRQLGLTTEGLERGEHTALLEVLNQNNVVQISSARVIFYLYHQSASVINRHEHVKQQKLKLFKEFKKKQQQQ